MSAKRKCQSDVGSNKRQWLMLEKKLDIIKSHEDGASFARIARANKINESSVRRIMKKRNNIKIMAWLQQVTCHEQLPKVEIQKFSMWNVLLIWIEDCNQKLIPMSQMTIQAKARSLYEAKTQKENDGETPTTSSSDASTFDASRGWFFHFKNHSGIHNVRIVGESGSADKEAAAKYPDHLKEIIEQGGYSDDQIFNVDETGLFWKKMPTRTFLAQKENSLPGYKVLSTINIVQIGKDLGFDNLDNNNVRQCINSHSAELDDGTLIEMDQQRAYEAKEEKEDGTDEPIPKDFSIADMEKIFSLVDEISQVIINGDPNIECGMTVRHNLEKQIRCYREFHAEKKGNIQCKLHCLNIFLKNKNLYKMYFFVLIKTS